MSGALSRIVLGVDFSEAGGAARETAVALCDQHGAELVLVHALEVVSFSLGFSRLPQQVYQEIRDLAQSRTEELRAELAQRVGTVSARLLDGHAHRALMDVAKECNADLIVLGTSGLTGWRGLLLGSTARRVIQHAECPVLTVPASESPRLQFERVLVPTDFSGDAFYASKMAYRLCAPSGPTEFHLLNVYATPLLQTNYGSVPTSIHYLDDFKGESLSQLEEKAEKVSALGASVKIHAVEGYPPEVIVEQADQFGVDLIAMGTRGAGALAHLVIGSTAEKVLQHAPCAVLTVRSAEASQEDVSVSGKDT